MIDKLQNTLHAAREGDPMAQSLLDGLVTTEEKITVGSYKPHERQPLRVHERTTKPMTTLTNAPNVEQLGLDPKAA